MQSLYTIEDKESGGVKTLLHVTSYYKYGLAVAIYTSDEFGTHKKRIHQHFLHIPEIAYHTTLRKNILRKGGIIHKRISATPLKRTKHVTSDYPDRDSRGRFIKHSNLKNEFSKN